MHRIDGPGATPGNLFTEEDPVLGVDPTQHTADWNNAVQEEIAGLIESTGAALNKADNTQLEAAVRAVARAEAGGFRNLLHNGDMRLWRRGTTLTLPVSGVLRAFGADRMFCSEGVGGSPAATITRKEHAVVPSNPGSRYYLEWVQSVGASTTAARMRQRIESVRTAQGLEVTMTVRGRVPSGTKTVTPYVEQFFGTGGTPSATVRTTGPTFTFTTTWNTYSWTFTLPDLTGKTIGTDEGSDYLEATLVWDGTSTFTVEVDQWTLELGGSYSGFEAVPFEVEVLRCSRFFETSYQLGTNPGTTSAIGALTDHRFIQTGEPFAGQSVIFAGLNDRFRVPMRKAPTVHWWNPVNGNADQIYMVSVEASPSTSNFTPNTHTASTERTRPAFKSGTIGNTNKENDLEAHYTADAEW